MLPAAVPGRVASGLGRALALLLFVGGLAVMMREVLLDPAGRSVGDTGDGLVLLATLEHWWPVLEGIPVGGTWRQAGFFYPVANPIGLTDLGARRRAHPHPVPHPGRLRHGRAAGAGRPVHRLTARPLRWRTALAATLFVLLLAEQLSIGLDARSTADVTAWFARVGTPPTACRSFYVAPGAGPPRLWFEYQSEAMMLAQVVGLPTLNGNSSWYPPGWDVMRDTTAPGYLAGVAQWIAKNRLQHVCRLDASSAQWSLEPGAPPS